MPLCALLLLGRRLRLLSRQLKCGYSPGGDGCANIGTLSLWWSQSGATLAGGLPEVENVHRVRLVRHSNWETRRTFSRNTTNIEPSEVENSAERRCIANIGIRLLLFGRD